MPDFPRDVDPDFSMMKNVNLLVVEHCTNTCTNCSTGSPFARKVYHSVNEFTKWLDVLVANNSDFEYISLTGGEPFLHPGVRDGSFIEALHDRYAGKKIGLTTNFYWANERRIEKYAPVIRRLNGGFAISLYDNIVEHLGGRERVLELAGC